ncbi:MAG: LysM peptidoglycan-binding domain-containing protein [Chloroflexi bacterium]|nr:LysM peptidoglycan-binding domain-containing protein [Chloroflexota bacterium]
MKSGYTGSRSGWLPIVIVIILLQLTACQAVKPSTADIVSPPAPFTSTLALLTPYQTPTASQTPFPPDPATYTPFPTPTSTPRSHIVQKGEDMYGIAFQYGITLQELLAANPDVDPNFMSVDMVLLIPASAQINQTEGVLPSPTPAGALPGSTDCYKTGEGGLWCFTSILNQSDHYIEGVSLQVRLGGEGVQVAVGSALTVINLIPPGAHIPATVYFPPPVPNPFEVSVLLETSLPVLNMSERYMPVSLKNLDIAIDPDGRSASVAGKVILDETGSPARIAAAAVAYNSKGDVVGFRRWENNDPSSPVTFSFQVYSLADAIEQVSVFAEAAR